MKRATGENTQEVKNSGISIHALVKRATKDEFISADYKLNFNPRPREEGDNITAILEYSQGNFNPRPREEGDYAE